MKKKFLIAAAAVVTTLMMAVPSLAANTPKEDYSYTYATGGATYTTARVKENQSSAYMICNSCIDIQTGRATGGGYTGVVYGAISERGSYINPVTKDGKGSSTYLFGVGTEHYMSNYVYDVYKEYIKDSNKDKIWAKVRGTMTGSTGYIKLSGKWAPDT